MPFSGSAFSSAYGKSCSPQHMRQISQLLEQAGAVPGSTADRLGQGRYLPAASHHCCLTGSMEEQSRHWDSCTTWGKRQVCL